MSEKEMRQMAMTLLLAIWRGINPDYKSKYRQTIWEQFENEIVSAAYTNNLAKFANSLCGRLDATIGTRAKERADCEAILNSGYDRALLKLMREETALLVLMVRVEMQQRRAMYEELDALEEEEN